MIVLCADCAVVASYAVLQRLARTFAALGIATILAARVYVVTNHGLARRARVARAMICRRARIAVGVAKLAIFNGFGAASRRITAVAGARIAIVADLARTRHTNPLFALIIFRASVLVRVTGHVVELGILAALTGRTNADIASAAAVAGRFIGLTVAVIIFAIAHFHVKGGRRARRKPAARTRAHTRALAEQFALVVLMLYITTGLRLGRHGRFAAGAFAVLQLGCSRSFDTLLDRRAFHRIYALTTVSCAAIAVDRAAGAAEIALRGLIDAGRVAIAQALAILGFCTWIAQVDKFGYANCDRIAAIAVD